MEKVEFYRYNIDTITWRYEEKTWNLYKRI